MIQPLKNKVVIIPEIREEEIKNGIIIPKQLDKEPINIGTVYQVGPGDLVKGVWYPTTVKPGDKVLFGKYSGTLVDVDGKEGLMILSEDDIWTIIT